jgi:hypothetical protein
MRCATVRRRLSAWNDGDLPPDVGREVSRHVAACPPCARRAAELEEVSRLLGDLPRLEARESVAQEVLTRLEVETRGPGLGLLLRRFGAARPFIMPALVPALLVLMTVLSATLALDSAPRIPGTIQAWGVAPALGTEGNPRLLSSGVGLPRETAGTPLATEILARGGGEESLFLETVVARDGTVSAVTVLQGDADRAGPLLEALRQLRYEPARFQGRPVAVSVYRLISRTEVSIPSI